jgi:integrase
VAEAVHRRVEQLVAHAIAGTAHEPELSAWLAAVPAPLYRRLVRVGLAAPRAADAPASRVTLETLIEKFLRRATSKAATRKVYAQCAASLREFFGADAALETITPEAADAWRSWLSEPHTIVVGRARTRVVKRLAVATQAKRLEVARQIFAKSIRWGLLERNPFEGVRGGSKVNVARWHYVSRQDTAAVLAACPTAEWRAIVGLARLAGLRVPSELIGLRWGDVGTKVIEGRRRVFLRVQSPKTEHHGDGHAQRLVPVSEELLEILEGCRRQAAPGETRIVPGVADGSVNLRTEFVRIVARARVAPWEKPFQNLRSSCETDWLEQFPGRIQAVAGWMGHSPAVAMRHYAQVLPQHCDGAAASADAFADVGAGEVAFSPAKRAPLYGGARPDPKVAQNPAQQGAELGSMARQPRKAVSRVPREKRGSPRIVRPEGSQRVGATRFERAASGPAEIEIAVLGGAGSGARTRGDHADPLLAWIVRSWPQLVPEDRLAILGAVAGAIGRSASTPRASDSDGSPPRPRKAKFRRHA